MLAGCATPDAVPDAAWTIQVRVVGDTDEALVELLSQGEPIASRWVALDQQGNATVVLQAPMGASDTVSLRVPAHNAWMTRALHGACDDATEIHALVGYDHWRPGDRWDFAHDC